MSISTPNTSLIFKTGLLCVAAVLVMLPSLLFGETVTMSSHKTSLNAVVQFEDVEISTASNQMDGMEKGHQNADPGHENPDPGKPEPVDLCVNIAEGCVTYAAVRVIVIDDETAFKTPLNWIPPQVDDKIRIRYWVNPDGENVACYKEIIGTCN